ncbi:MAG: alpha/beta hydrolase [Rhizobiales bacterium]|nr:alpha/beta hydrolase [Hyphomicrobiales bacterium]
MSRYPTWLSSTVSVAFIWAGAAYAADVPMAAPEPIPSPAAITGKCPDPDKPKCTVKLATGIDMAYIEAGPENGRPIILLHGLTDSSRSWSPAMAALNAADPGLRIFALDQRGHGATSMPAGATCPASPKSCFIPPYFVADVAAFMNAMKIEKAWIAGHSMGSVVAQQLALDRPDRVSGIVLVATTAKTKDNVIVRDYVLKEPVMGAWKKGLEAKGITSPEAVWIATPRDADPNADDWILKNWDVDPIADQAFIKAIVPETAVVKMGTWIGATEALLEFDNSARIASLAVPTLVLWGTQDAIFYKDPDQTGLLAALRAGKAPFVWKQYGTIALPASGYQENEIGHNVQWEAPREVAADILSFVNTGKPTPDHYVARPGGSGFEIVTEIGKAIIETR